MPDDVRKTTEAVAVDKVIEGPRRSVWSSIGIELNWLRILPMKYTDLYLLLLVLSSSHPSSLSRNYCLKKFQQKIITGLLLGCQENACFSPDGGQVSGIVCPLAETR